MSDRPLVSIITPTFGDPARLNGVCIPSILAQTYPNIEHVIVSDGPNDDLPEVSTPTQRIVHLGRNWHSFTRPSPSWGTMARLVASGLVRGDYVAYNDHDDALLPQHVEKLVDLLESTGSDWVYSAMLVLWNGQPNNVCGDGTPRWRAMSTQMLLHRVEMFNVANWDPYCKDNLACLPRRDRQFATYGSDWDLVHRWLKSSAKWAFLPEVTIHHYRFTNKE